MIERFFLHQEYWVNKICENISHYIPLCTREWHIYENFRYNFINFCNTFVLQVPHSEIFLFLDIRLRHCSFIKMYPVCDHTIKIFWTNFFVGLLFLIGTRKLSGLQLFCPVTYSCEKLSHVNRSAFDILLGVCL